VKVQYARVKYPDVKLNSRDSVKLRGYFARKYIDVQAMHNHRKDGFVYQYPKVQYKIVGNVPYIIGLEECADLVASIGLTECDIAIDNECMNLGNPVIVTNSEDFGLCDEMRNYEFATTWIALNQENARKYEVANRAEKEEMLKKILIGNLISMSKGFHYDIERRIKVELDVQEVRAVLKAQDMVAFIGQFSTNFTIPDYVGIGKSVSRGFGTVRAI
jgi:hypothetical protein